MKIPMGTGAARSRAFTLVELLVAVSISAMVLGAAYLCLHASLSSQKLIEDRADAAQRARVALDLLKADLQVATPLSPDSEFLGMSRMLGDVEADNLDFATHHYTPQRPGEGDFCEISYFVDRSPENGSFSLWRRRDVSPDLELLAGGSRDEIAQHIQGFRVEYYDGLFWYDEWGNVENRRERSVLELLEGNAYGMPDAVRITLFLLPGNPSTSRASSSLSERNSESPLVFQTIVHLNLAARSRLTSAGSGSSQTNNQTGSPQGATPNTP